MQNVPTKDDNLDDFDDDDDWGANPQKSNPVAATMGKGAPNPMIRQQVNQARPMTSGKPGQRGFHGIGKYKPMDDQHNLGDDDFADMLDMAGGPSNNKSKYSGSQMLARNQDK